MVPVRLLCSIELVLANQQARGRNHDPEFFRGIGVDEGGGAVLGIEERVEEGEALAQGEHIQRSAPGQRIDRMRLGRFVAEAGIAAADAVELIGGVQAEKIGQRRPFENMGVDVQLIPGQGEDPGAAVRHDKSGDELLLPRRLDLDDGREFFLGQDLIALHGYTDGGEEGGQGEHQQGADELEGGAEIFFLSPGAQGHIEEDQAKQGKNERGDDQRIGQDHGFIPSRVFMVGLLGQGGEIPVARDLPAMCLFLFF